jgi:MFS family permease
VTTTESGAPLAKDGPTTLSSSTVQKSPVKVLWASLVGTSLESYDFYVFSYLSVLFMGPLFFEPLGVFGGTLAALSTNAVGFFARPLGAIVFGHLGDRVGRRATLIATITIMGVATGAIGLLPTYAQGGWVGAILLLTLRLIQGFSLGGEWGGGVLIATEHASKRNHAFYASFPQLGSPIGNIITALLYIFLPLTMGDAFFEWGWRIPFLAAFVFLAVSLYLRITIDESPVFRAVLEKEQRVRVPLAVVFRTKPVALVLGVGVALLGIGSYSLMNSYTLSYGAAVLGFDYNELLLAVTIGAVLQLVTIPLFGVLANRIGSWRVVLIGAVGTLIVAFPIYFLLQSASFAVLVGMMIIGGILPTMSWAALGGLLSELFGARIRYSAISFAYAIAAIISGLLLPLTYAFGAAVDQAWWHPGVVLAAISLITAVSAYFAGRRTLPVEES